MRTKEIWAAARETAYEAALEMGQSEWEAERYADQHADEYATQILANLHDYARMTEKERRHHG